MTKDIPAFLLTVLAILGAFHLVYSVTTRWRERKPLFTGYENIFDSPLSGVALTCYAVHSLSAEKIIVLPVLWERVLIYVPLGSVVYAHFRYRNPGARQLRGIRTEEAAGAK